MESQYLKDGKFAYYETKLRPETHPFAATAIIDFREYRKRIEATELNDNPGEEMLLPPIYNVPLMMIAQDSEESLQTLANRLNELLSPFNRDEMLSDLFTTTIEHRIKSTMTRIKYGLDLSSIEHIEGSPAFVPSHFYTCRWEANDITQFPDDFKTFITRRRDRRKQASNGIIEYFRSMQTDAQLSLLSSKPRKQQTSSTVEETRVKIKTAEEIAIENEKRRKKEEERQKKEEEKQKKEEEKRKREEEKQVEKRKREQERKKKEQSQLRLTSLFTKNTDDKTIAPMERVQIESRSMFPPFFVKENVTVHSMPTIKPSQNDITNIINYEIDSDIIPQESMEMKYKYLQELNNNRPQLTKPRGIHRKVDLKNLLLPGISGSNLDAIHRPEYKLLLKMKFLQFTEDVRPAYYGTWTKQSDKIKGNAPFTKDIDILDYEHESEAEWEPEGEGEDIQSGDDDDDDAPEMADSEDIGWLVPEGYLSEGEGVDSDDGMSKIVNRLSMRPNSRKKLTIRPVIIGPILENDDDMVENEALVSLGVKTLINIDENGYNPFAVIDNKPTDDTNKTITTSSTNNTNFTEEHTTELLSIFEGKADNLPKLLSEAKASPLLNSFPKTQLEAKIRDIAVKEKRGNDARPVWHVKPEKDSTIQ